MIFMIEIAIALVSETRYSIMIISLMISVADFHDRTQFIDDADAAQASVSSSSRFK